MDSQIDPPSFHEKRKSRAQLSCTQCRHKKLKCDRGYPCDQCAKRNHVHLCQYATLSHNKTTQFRHMARPRDIISRVRDLENLVLSLRPENIGNQPKEGDVPTNTHLAIPHTYDANIAPSRLTEDVSIREPFEVNPPGAMIADQKGTRWVDVTHWQAILDSMAELKDCTETLERIGSSTAGATAADENSAPILFAGVFPNTSKLEILAFLPPRPVVDRLVSRFFNAKEPGLMILHVPTFYTEYTQFWENQEEATNTWIGLLFVIMCFSAIFHHRVGDDLPGSLGEPMLVSKVYMTKAAQCLVLADYTKPGRYKVETLLLYLGTEFMRSSDTQLGISMLLGIIVRLAMYTGYHRDSKHYPTESVFHGEMKRRVWALISQTDHLISFQAGLPRLIQDLQCDTELPHNLFDEDFDETARALPSSRPSTERTPVSYTITKGKLMSVFGRIIEKTHSMRTPEHEVVQLDKCLQETHALFPPFLRIRKMNLSITDPPDLIMQRYTLELLYQKARCVLHRKYLTIHRSDLRYAYSRWVCVDAAMQILGHQNDIYHEILPGGQLYKDRWFMSSLMTHDFLLAAMILCLELSCRADNGKQALNSEAINAVIEDPDKLLESLEVSHRIWSVFTAKSLEARKASKALTVILQNARRNTQRDHHPKSQDINLEVEEEGMFESSRLTDPMPGATLVEEHVNQIGYQNIIEDSMLRAIDGMMDAPEAFDWDTWDSQIQFTNGTASGSTWMDRSANSEFP